jgi:hypothetical protein
VDAEQDQGEQEVRVEGVERRQHQAMALLLAQPLRALHAGEQPKGVEQVEQHGGERGRVDQPQRRRQQREHVADRPEQQVEGDRDGDVGDHDRQPAHQAAPKQPPRAQDAVRRGLRIAGHNQGLQHHRREHPEHREDQVQQSRGPREALDRPVAAGRLVAGRLGSSELGFAQGVGGSHVVPSGRGRQIREGRLGVGASGCR